MQTALGGFAVYRVPAILLCAFTLSPASDAAPVPTHLMPPIPFYFPITAGAKWVYVSPTGEEQVIEVVDVKRDGDDLVFSRKGDYVPSDKIIVSVDGLRYTRDTADGKTTGGVMMKAKFRQGESWRMLDGSERTISGPEVVEVPAGKFNAIKVVVSDYNQIIWYAAGIGEVKRSSAGGEETVIRSLKSFTPGERK